MKIWAVASLCGALGASPLVAASTQAPLLTPRDSALHALNRLAYGPRPGEVDRVAAAGVMQWIDRQLSPDKIDDAALTERERQFKILEYDAGELAGDRKSTRLNSSHLVISYAVFCLKKKKKKTRKTA